MGEMEKKRSQKVREELNEFLSTTQETLGFGK